MSKMNTVNEPLGYVKILTRGWSRRSVILGGFLMFILFSTYLMNPYSYTSRASLPSSNPDYFLSPTKDPNRYNASKVALLIENRPDPILAPLLLQFIAVVPQDWKFQFMGSKESVAFLNTSRAIREQVADGKLDMTYIPSNMTTGSQEEISVFLTTLWLYEVVLQPAEWLLVFQTDSMLCANSRRSLNDWLDYDWVGAPWNPAGDWGGNGGLSLRKVSSIIDVLRTKKRLPHKQAEDVFLSEELAKRPGSKMAGGPASLVFSGELFSGVKEKVSIPFGSNSTSTDPTLAGELVTGVDDWRDGFYEPMGYHIGGSGKMLHTGIWGTPETRKHIWEYCPEVKMMLDMDVAKYVPGDCHKSWKRGEGEGEEGEQKPKTEIIDGKEYPLIPAGLMTF